MVLPLRDGSLMVDGVQRSFDRHVIQFTPPHQTIRAIRFELLRNSNRFHIGPSRDSSGHCLITGFTLTSLSGWPINRLPRFCKSTPTIVQTAFMQSPRSISHSYYRQPGEWSGVNHDRAAYLNPPRAECVCESWQSRQTRIT